MITSITNKYRTSMEGNYGNKEIPDEKKKKIKKNKKNKKKNSPIYYINLIVVYSVYKIVLLRKCSAQRNFFDKIQFHDSIKLTIFPYSESEKTRKMGKWKKKENEKKKTI